MVGVLSSDVCLHPDRAPVRRPYPLGRAHLGTSHLLPTSMPLLLHSFIGVAVLSFNSIVASWMEQGVPTISTFYGIVIQMFWNDHAPPHFHALYGEHEVLLEIGTLGVMRGSFPRRALALVLEWAQEHRDELLEDWNLCAEMQHPRKIDPLP